MQFSSKRAKILPEVPIIPMIDTMFFLLVFFILTSLNVIKLEGVNVHLPKAAHSIPTTRHADLTVTITANQKVYVNGGHPVPAGKDIGPLLLQALAAELHHAPSSDDLSKQSVIINADGDTPHHMVVDAIDQARNSHINKFSIATTRGAQNAVTPAAAGSPAP
jgi:biopolymer transport protein ExbD